MPIASSTSAGSLFSPKAKARDPNATLKKARPPPLDTATIARKNSGWSATTLTSAGGSSSTLGLTLGPVDEHGTQAETAGRGQAKVDEFGGLGSGGLLGSFQQVGQWGENVTRSLLDAASYRSRSPGSGPSTPRANSPFNPPNRPPPPAPVSGSNKASSASHPTSTSSSPSPRQTPTLTPSHSSTASSPFSPSSTLSSLFSLSSLSSVDSPETPPTQLDASLRSLDSSESVTSPNVGLERSKSKDVLGKIWRKGAGTIGRRGTDPGGLAAAAAEENDQLATLRPRKSRGALGSVRGHGSGNPKGGIEGGASSSTGTGGGGLTRRLSRNFGSFNEFGSMRKSASASRNLSGASIERSLSSPANGASPPSPSDERAFVVNPRIPPPPPFFYGMAPPSTEDTPPEENMPEEPEPIEEPTGRRPPTFGNRSLSVRSSGPAPWEAGSETRMERSRSDTSDVSIVETDESFQSSTMDDSLEDAEIGFGEAARFEWAGFASPVGSSTPFRLNTRDRSPTDTSSADWIATQRSVGGSRAHHRQSPSLGDLDLTPANYEPSHEPSHSRASSLSANFTIRNSPARSTRELPDCDHDVGTPTRSSTPSSCSTGHVRVTSHTTNLSSSSFRNARDSPRSFRSGFGSTWSSPAQSPMVAIRIIEATPAKTRLRPLPDSPESDHFTDLSPPRSDGSDDAGVEEAWASAKARFSESFERRTSGECARDRTVTGESSASSFGTPMLQGSHSFASFLDEQRRGGSTRNDKHLSTSSMPQNLLERYYAPSLSGLEDHEGGSSGEDEFVSAEEEAGGTASGSGIIETLMAHLEGSWDDEVVEDVKAAMGWQWPMPPLREVWIEFEEGTGRQIERSAVVQSDTESKLFPLSGPLPARHVYVYQPSPSSQLQTSPLALALA